MESTGMVRRIDELGRIVIPKEIRKTMRLREGEEMEILLGQGELVFKKFSALSNISVYLEPVVAALQKQIGGTALVVDNESVVISTSKAIVAKTAISPDVDLLLSERRAKRLEGAAVFSVAGEPKERTDVMLFVPIIVNGDLYGAIIVLSPRSVNLSCVELAAKVLENILS